MGRDPGERAKKGRTDGLGNCHCPCFKIHLVDSMSAITSAAKLPQEIRDPLKDASNLRGIMKHLNHTHSRHAAVKNSQLCFWRTHQLFIPCMYLQAIRKIGDLWVINRHHNKPGHLVSADEHRAVQVSIYNGGCHSSAMCDLELPQPAKHTSQLPFR